MADPKHKLDREEIMSFLLGELEEAETSRIEAMFLSNPTYSEAIEEAKSQLYQDYKSGRLSPQQSGRFEARYLPNLDEDKRKFQAMLDRNEAKRLAGLDAVPTPVPSAPSPAKTNPVTLDSVPATGRNMLVLVGVLVLAIAGLGVALLLRGGESKRETISEPVTLSVFSVRGRSQLIVLPDRPRVVLHLPLPPGEPSESFVIVAYHGDSEALWPAVRLDSVVETTVEKAALEAGRYDLELRRGDDSVVGYYSLQK